MNQIIRDHTDEVEDFRDWLYFIVHGRNALSKNNLEKDAHGKYIVPFVGEPHIDGFETLVMDAWWPPQNIYDTFRDKGQLAIRKMASVPKFQ